jgi:ribonuclease PH
MKVTMKRSDGRQPNELRPLNIIYNIFEYAPGSVLIELGKTKVLCAVSLQQTVPHFMRGKGTGWLSAEYALLPASTSVRTQREISNMRRNNRSVEISRLIGRTLRTLIDFSALGERSITVDCDVLQADAGTRTASIIGAFAALQMAQEQWKAEGIITQDILADTIAAVSVAVMHDGTVLLDPNYEEDSGGLADINFIMTHTGRVIEVQGGAEKDPIEWEHLMKAGELAKHGIADIARFLKEHAFNASAQPSESENKSQKGALFSLGNRQHDASL